jgi:hypothetical protein
VTSRQHPCWPLGVGRRPPLPWARRLLDTTWKTVFGNGCRSPLLTGNAPVTNQVLQISQES